jgi:hypothetical protein
MLYLLVLEFSLFFLPDILLRVSRAAIGRWNGQGFRRLFPTFASPNTREKQICPQTVEVTRRRSSLPWPPAAKSIYLAQWSLALNNFIEERRVLTWHIKC